MGFVCLSGVAGAEGMDMTVGWVDMDDELDEDADDIPGEVTPSKAEVCLGTGRVSRFDSSLA
jgi:hypothetical protein